MATAAATSTARAIIIQRPNVGQEVYCSLGGGGEQTSARRELAPAAATTSRSWRFSHADCFRAELDGDDDDSGAAKDITRQRRRRRRRVICVIDRPAAAAGGLRCSNSAAGCCSLCSFFRVSIFYWLPSIKRSKLRARGARAHSLWAGNPIKRFRCSRRRRTRGASGRPLDVVSQLRLLQNSLCRPENEPEPEANEHDDKIRQPDKRAGWRIKRR